LRKLLLIVSILLLTTAVNAQAQSRNALVTAGLQSSILRFYPNPATTVINFDFQRSYEKGYSIQIYNAIIGRKMKEQTNLADKTTIDLSNFTRGVYVYQLFDKSGKLVETGKFQVSK
jgi:hypothetical protein